MNLIEATCKAILLLHDEIISEQTDLPTLVHSATIALGLHAMQASGPTSNRFGRSSASCLR
jgi:hypothetical protein